jgi:hypothetical protein
LASDGAASDGAAPDAAVVGAAADGAAADGALVAPVPVEQAVTTNAVVARTPNMRQRVDTTRLLLVLAARGLDPPRDGRSSNVRCGESFGLVPYRFRGEP